MTKENYEQLKSKEAQIEKLIEMKHMIESSKILSVKVRVFNESKLIYEDKELFDLPKKELRKVISENYLCRLNKAKSDWEGFFDDFDMFEENEENKSIPAKYAESMELLFDKLIERFHNGNYAYLPKTMPG